MAQNGGPAFPIDRRVDDDGNFINGMTLRDYFAGQALSGILAELNAEECVVPSVSAIVHEAYNYAEAMLLARGN